MPQVFGCPNCQNPFQVPDNAAGETFQCPSCQSTIEVPAFEAEADPAPQQPTAEPEIFQCPHCSGQFGINSSMYGENLSCPHCENTVAIGPAPVKELIATPEIVTDEVRPEVSESVKIQTASDAQFSEADVEDVNVVGSPPTVSPAAQSPTDDDEVEAAVEAEPLPEPVFEPQPVDHLLPPRFAVPDPIRFPARRGSREVILPDGEGGYQAVDANIVTITHEGQVYHLKRLTPDERRKRRFIHNTIAICIAVLLIYLTLKTLGVFL